MAANIIFSEKSAKNDKVFGSCVTPIKMFITETGEAFEQQSQIENLFNKVPSERFAETYGGMTAMNDWDPVPEGGAYGANGFQEGYSKVIMNDVQWMSKFPITQMIIEDNNLLELKRRPQAFVTAYYRTRENFAARMYGEAIKKSKSFSIKGKTFDITTADGEALFSKTHPSILDKNFKQSNMFVDEFSAKNLGLMETKMQDFRGDAEELRQVAPQTILIANDAELKDAVLQAIGADKVPDSPNNGFNYHYGRWDLIVWPYLNQFITKSSKPWLLMDTRYNELQMGSILQDRVPLTVSSYVDDNTDDLIHKGRARFNGGFFDWRFVCGGGIAGGDNLASA